MYKNESAAINYKPKFNLKWNNNNGIYSEGDIEDKLIEYISSAEPENYSKIIYDHFSWPVYYHLTDERKNMINWYPFKKNSSILEIGCGLGAITNLLCDKAASVTSVELSERRAYATFTRCRERDNLEIIVGNLNDIEFEQKYDYITLIGVLEYQGQYTRSDHPYQDFLEKIRSLLKPDGKLLIAIENKYGLKYWCGSPEDHTGVPFDGMNQYHIGNQAARTFSKHELKELLTESGYLYTYFYYPLPDYKLPTVIYSEEHLPGKNYMENFDQYNFQSKNTLIADEKNLYHDLIENGVFEFFANSFFVECSPAKNNVGEVIFASVSKCRLPEYRMITAIYKNNFVAKYPCFPSSGHAHIAEVKKNLEEMEAAQLSVIPFRLENNSLITEKIKAPTVDTVLFEAFHKKDLRTIISLFDQLKAEISKSSQHASAEANCLLSIDGADPAADYGPILKKGYIDMIFRNAFLIDGNMYWYDQEWSMENIPEKYILCRNIAELYQYNKWIQEIIPSQFLLERYQLTSFWPMYHKLEDQLLNKIFDPYQCTYRSVLVSTDSGIYARNVQKLFAAPMPAEEDLSSEIDGIISYINQFLKLGKYRELLDAFQEIDISDINDRRLIIWNRILKQAQEELEKGIPCILEGKETFEQAVNDAENI